ncbi:hypothetical protein ABK040_013884 [Willaertia magna]
MSSTTPNTIINYSLLPRLTSNDPNFLTPCNNLIAPTNYFCYLGKYTQQNLLEPIGEPLYPLFKPLYDVLEEKGSSIGLKADQTIFVLMLFLTYFWSFIYRLIFNNQMMRKQYFLKQLYIATIGLFYAIFTFGYEGMHGVTCALVSYFAMLILPKYLAPKFVCVFVWAYLATCHLIRMQLDYTSQRVDYSAMLMMMVLRINSCAFNYADGLNPKKEQELEDVLIEASIEKIPSFIEYLSFCFYFPALLAGPAFEIKYFQSFLRNYDEDSLPISIKSLLFNTLLIFISFAGFTQIDRFDREFIMNSPNEFSALSLIEKILFIELMVVFFKYRYYLVWHIAQGACWLSGFGYNKKKKVWDAFRQIDYFGFELATSPFLLSVSWNMSVNVFLKKFIYLRNKKKGEKPGTASIFTTFLLVAFWHGFYPGYYIFFVLAGMGVEFGRMFRSMFRHRVIPPDYDFDLYKPIESLQKINLSIALYNFVAWILTHISTYYIAASFVLLSVEHTLFMWKETYTGIIGVV